MPFDKAAYNREWMRKWRLAHPEEHRQETREWAAEKRKRQTLDERNAAHRRWKERDPVHYLLQHAKHRAKTLGVAFDLAREDIVIPEACPVFGTPWEWGEGKMGWRNMRAPSLDRVRAGLGYVRGNVRVISTRANHVKGNASISEMEAVLAYMREAGADVDFTNDVQRYIDDSVSSIAAKQLNLW